MCEPIHSLLELGDEIASVLLRVTILTGLVPEALDRAICGLSHAGAAHVRNVHLVLGSSRKNVFRLSQVELVLVDLRKMDETWG